MPTITVPLRDGSTLPATVYYGERGLAVQKHPRAPAHQARWGVVHVASGLLVAALVFKTRAGARDCQRALLGLEGIDWQPRKPRLARAEKRRVVEVVQCYRLLYGV